jgi:protein TonB
VTNNDYPTRALRENRAGVTGFRLTYGADGRPTGCDVTSSSGSPELDSTACSLLMRRAKFNPGQDSDGNPTGGVYASRFRWVIPEE